jgi:hypothetical protein
LGSKTAKATTQNRYHYSKAYRGKRQQVRKRKRKELPGRLRLVRCHRLARRISSHAVILRGRISFSFLRAEVNMTIVLFPFDPTERLLCCVAVPHSCSVLLCGVVFASGGLVFMTSLVQQWSRVLGTGGYMDCTIDGSGNGLRVGSISDGMYLYRASMEGLEGDGG